MISFSTLAGKLTQGRRRAEVSASSNSSKPANGFKRKLKGFFADHSVLGNPLHEAWSADGEPLERMNPNEVSKRNASRHIVVPHNRSR